FINKVIRKYSIYTKSFSQQSFSEQFDNHDTDLLSQIKLQDILQRNFIPLSVVDTLLNRREDIIHSDRTIFPVVDHTGKLISTINIDEILEILSDPESHSSGFSGDELVHVITRFNTIDTAAREVLHYIEKSCIQILRVINSYVKYIGFISKDAVFKKYRLLFS